MTQIINRYTGQVITQGDMNLRELVLCFVHTARADLIGADLRGADLRGANLRGADLRGADLSDADLSGADLSGAYLRGADLSDVKIKSAAVFTGIYKYIVMPVIAEDGTEYIRMGCHFRTVKDWGNDFWNNPQEFPNNGDMASKLRQLAYKTCIEWLAMHRSES